jgi:phosphate:Na+ symporter
MAFGLIGGLALFLYGMILVSEGMQKAAGEQLKNALEAATRSPLRGIMTGGVITSIIQSSSVTTVTVVGLINSGLMTLEQSAGIILGADIGTTVTAQIVAFPIGQFALVIIGIGFLMNFLGGNNKRVSNYGQALLGLGILFLGMNIMKEGVESLQNAPFVIEMFSRFGRTPILGVLIGAAFTGIIQSSSATSGLVIAMGTTGIIDLNTAVALMYGANIGTCVTALLASIGTSLSARRAALLHILIKIVWATIFFLPMPLLIWLASHTSPHIGRQIANAHTLFNIIGTIVILPFLALLIVAVKKLLPGEEIKIERGAKYIDMRTMGTPSVALSQAGREVVRMAEIAETMVKDGARLFLENQTQLIPTIRKQEESVDELNRILREYLIILSGKPMSKEENQKVAGLMHAITDIERVGDHINNITEMAGQMNKEKLSFSPEAKRDLKEMLEKVIDTYSATVEVLRTWDKKLTKAVIDKEAEVDRIEEKCEENHLKRMEQGVCSPHAGIIYTDLLRNLERIGDHSDNIAHMILIGF